MNAPTTEPRAGGCHCGAVRYEAAVDLTSPVLACNCSICGKTGSLLGFVPAAQFRLLAGADALRDYQFGAHRVHHLFCSRCGVRSFSRGNAPDGTEMVAVNVRCLDDVDVAALTVQNFDGKSL